MNRIHFVISGAAFLAAAPCYATIYHTTESAQKACFPGATSFTKADVDLTSAQAKAIEKDSGVRVRLRHQRVWKAMKNGNFLGWLIVDEVIGKHEYITWALALDAGGAVRNIEIMEYRETYGDQIRTADFRAQFFGKKHGAKLQLDEDIKNISGATLSCNHITEGVRRLLSFYDLVLKP